MLVLSRKDGQRITLTTQGGEQITVCIDRIGNRSARVSIDAPQSVRVLRNEIAENVLPPGKPSTAGQADNDTAGQ
jgi:carbon storage regulator CsrA